jgi:hypothetical protein
MDHQMIVAMLAEGHPVWYVAAMVNKNSHDVETIATTYGYPDPRRLRHAAHHLTRTTRLAA